MSKTIKRDANQVAHELARRAFSLKTNYIWVDGTQVCFRRSCKGFDYSHESIKLDVLTSLEKKINCNLISD
jgi:hypothetical protein